MVALQKTLPMARTPLPLPRELYIESTTRCNEFCDQCPRTHLGREADRDITPDEVERIVAQIPTLERVVLHGLGEPLLNARLPEIITLLRKRNIWTLFNSNALLLNERRGRALLAADLNELRISLDGATPGMYARIRGVNERALPLIIRNLTAFERLKRELGVEHPRASLWFTAMRENFHELPRLVDIAVQTGIREVYVQRFIYFGKGLAREEQAVYRQTHEREQAYLAEAEARCAAEGIRFTATGATTPASYLATGSDSQDDQMDRLWSACQRPYRLAYITAHGNVYSCCFAPFDPGPRSQKILGNVFDQPFAAIWNGERYAAFRAAFESDAPWPHCEGCGTRWSL